MKRTALVIVVCLFVTVVLAGCGSSASPTATGSNAEPVKIGAILSLTGTYAALGASEKNAIEMEVARINAAGGVDGRPIEVIIEDDATDPKQAVAAATKLIDKDQVVAIIGATGTGATMAIRSDAQRAGVPIISMAGGSVITDDFDANTFQTPWPNRLVVAFTIAQLKKDGVTRVALISSSDGYGKDGHDVALAALKEAGIDVVADEAFNPGDTDMTTQVTKIRSKAPQVIWMWNAGREAAIVAKNLRQIDPDQTMRLYGAPGNARVEFPTGAGDASSAFRFAAGKVLLPETYGVGTEAYQVATDFIARYKAAYKGASPDIFAGHAYDALAVTVAALKKAGADATGPELRNAIEQTSGLVGIGGTFTYSATDHNGLTESDLVMYEIVNGAWTLVP